MNRFLSLLLLFGVFFGIQMLHEGLRPFDWDDVAINEETSLASRMVLKASPLLFKVENEKSFYLWKTAEVRARGGDRTIRFLQLPYGKWYQY